MIISARENRGFHQALTINRWGLFDVQIPQEQIAMFDILSVEPHEKVRQFLLQNWTFKQEMELFNLSLPKDVATKMMRLVNEQEKGNWVYVADPSISLHVLALETKLGAKNQQNIGVIYAHAGQTTEEEMFSNKRKITLICKHF